MKAPKKKVTRTRHPTLWTVEVVRWEFREHETEYQRVLAKKREKGPGVQLGETIDRAEVPDRPYAIAIGHHLLDRYAEEAAGRMSLEVHVHPPAQDLGDETVYTVTDEVLEQARQLGIEGDVEQQVKVMARDATPFTHPKGRLRHGRYVLKVQGNDVTWIGLVDPPEGSGKGG
jgi:hypothetical protein